MAPLPAGAPPGLCDRRGAGIAGTLAALVLSGEPVLAVAADARLRARQLGRIAGGFDLCSHTGLRGTPDLVGPAAHVVAIDPPATPAQASTLVALAADRTVHLLWGRDELDSSVWIHERDHVLRAPLAAVYRALRDRGGAAGEELEMVLRAPDPAQPPLTPAAAGRALRVLAELGLVSIDRDPVRVSVPAAERTSLDRSPAYRDNERRLQDGLRYLTGATQRAA
jgi:single-stranded-DNA-specific exonuclease